MASLRPLGVTNEAVAAILFVMQGDRSPGSSPLTLLAPLLLASLAGAPSARQLGDDLRTEAIPARPLDARRLRSAFLDLYGRPPFLAERERWAGRALSELVDEALGSTELWRNWLEEELYYFLLIENFKPTSDRVLAVPEALAAGEIGVRDALHRIALCASFDRRNPGNDTFVTVLMEQLLGLTVQRVPRELEIGKRLYDGAKGSFLGRAGASQADVVRIAVEDPRALRHFLSRECRRLLRREAETRELGEWRRVVGKDGRGFARLLREWFLSEDYDHRLTVREPQPNRVFVRSLFVDLVDRLPDESETHRMRNALDGLADAGPLRSVIARLLIDSGQVQLPARDEVRDPTAWIGTLFDRYLGRAARPEELAAFVRAFHDPACRPQTVVYAIVSHPEYQTW